MIPVVQQGKSSGCGAAWIARLTGGQKVAGSNPVTPTFIEGFNESQALFSGMLTRVFTKKLVVSKSVAADLAP